MAPDEGTDLRVSRSHFLPLVHPGPARAVVGERSGCGGQAHDVRRHQPNGMPDPVLRISQLSVPSNCAVAAAHRVDASRSNGPAASCSHWSASRFGQVDLAMSLVGLNRGRGRSRRACRAQRHRLAFCSAKELRRSATDIAVVFQDALAARTSAAHGTRLARCCASTAAEQGRRVAQVTAARRRRHRPSCEERRAYPHSSPRDAPAGDDGDRACQQSGVLSPTSRRPRLTSPSSVRSCCCCAACKTSRDRDPADHPRSRLVGRRRGP